MGDIASTEKKLHWHLKGNWAPVEKELTESELQVKGEIPKDLSGLFVRNGFNPVSGYSDHWFFGNGMLHGVYLENGKASYRNRYVRTPYYENDLNVMSSFGDLVASPANTHIVNHAGKLLALEETSLPWELNKDLDTIGVEDFNGKLDTAMTAHPRVCPETGEMLFFGYSMFSEPYLSYYRVSKDGALVQSEAIELPRPVMMHDWNITRNYVVFMDLPIVADMDLAATTGSPFGFKPECGARLGVMPRAGNNSDVRWFDIDPCFVFHSFNSFEIDNKIVLYVSRQQEAMVGGFKDIYGGETTVARLWRWIIDLEKGTVSEEQLDDEACDFPRINDDRIGLYSEFGYCMQLKTDVKDLTFGENLYKYHLETGKRIDHHLGDNVAGGEPVFAAKHGATEEDEGWILSLVHERETRRSKLIIIDAQSFDQQPVAEVIIPQRVPYGAHGSWIQN
ncbi:carotenoid oxygenase family protein [SAR86 cluster bacterium]|nr:carotenoid oxygenase family protein [SAR86 cluster bacterium]